VAQQRRGLGRGLGALIPESPRLADGETAPYLAAGQVPPGAADSADAPVEVPGAHYREIPVSAITPNPRQPRRTFDEDTLEELAESIREVGLLQPVVVRAAGPGRYELIMGERRWRATQRAGLTEIGAIVKQTQDNELLRDALIENLHRQQLDPLEEAAAYQQLLDDFGATHEQLAQKIGRSRPHISNTLRLLNLPPTVQKRVAAGVLSAGHARALLSLNDPAAQERLAARIVAEGLSVRNVEEIVALGGDEAPRKRAPAARQPVAPGLRRLADRLSDAFETRVKVEMGRHKGKIIVEFASPEDLERIVKAMRPEMASPEGAELSGMRYKTAEGAGQLRFRTAEGHRAPRLPPTGEEKHIVAVCPGSALTAGVAGATIVALYGWGCTGGSVRSQVRVAFLGVPAGAGLGSPEDPGRPSLPLHRSSNVSRETSLL
jgi:ParB family chromosome partitioning protein